ncbi:MAG: GNAT family N-acetyltransferase [Muribaculaceae bacterium]|nr:GNAT family N-acetyltransferase [Muribaculaceae bacterium]
MAIVFEKLKMEDYPNFLSLYNSTFPHDQKRIYEDEKHLDNYIKMKGGKFNAFSAVDGDLYLGFLSYWTFEGYTYIEHFAVAPEQRGKNLGRMMLEHLFKEVSPNVLLETEPGDTPEALKRIEFYEKNGFKVRKEINYTQPSYGGKGQQAVPMLLMTHGDVDLHNIDSIKDMLQEVYNVNNASN